MMEWFPSRLAENRLKSGNFRPSFENFSPNFGRILLKFEWVHPISGNLTKPPEHIFSNVGGKFPRFGGNRRKFRGKSRIIENVRWHDGKNHSGVPANDWKSQGVTVGDR